MRIVSLTCSNTEIVCALDCADLLVGVDSDSDYPAEVVAKLPRVGRDLDIEIDKVKALKPDLVLASLTVPGHERVVTNLERAGLPYLAPEPCSLEDVFADIRLIGKHLGVAERAEQLIGDAKAELVPITHRTRPRVLLQWWPKPVIAPGSMSWAHDLLELCGAENVLADEAIKSRPMDDTEVATLNPDLVVMSWCGVKAEKYRAEVVLENPAFANVGAVRNQRVYPVPEAHLGRPSLRLLDGYRDLKKLIRSVV
ncbi:MAG: cobalamin-binding protein [Pseudomonadota bacterium]